MVEQQSPLKIDYLQPLLKQLLDNYHLMDRQSPTSYILWSSKTHNTNIVIKHVCHSSMCRDSKGFDNLITALPNTDEISMSYQQMLVQGPFRSFSDTITIETIGDKSFIHVSNLDRWPANVLYNYCIASRQPIEHMFTIENWYERTKAGVNPTLAYLLSVVRRQTYDKSGYNYNSNHMWFNEFQSDWTSLLSGKIVNQSESFYESPSDVRPCNVIWGKAGDNGRSLSIMTDEQIYDHFKLKPVVEVEEVKPKRMRGKSLYFGIEQMDNPMAEMVPAAPQQFNPWNLNFAAIIQAGQPEPPLQPPVGDLDFPDFDDEDFFHEVD